METLILKRYLHEEEPEIKRIDLKVPEGLTLVASYRVNISKDKVAEPCTINIYYGKGKGYYRVIEPEVHPTILDKLRKAMSFFFKEVPPSPVAELDPAGYLEAELRKAGAFNGLREEEVNKVRYYILREVSGYGVITPIIMDPFVEDISCEGEGRPVRVWHSRFNKYYWLETNIVLSREEIDSLLMKFASRCGSPLSSSTPILDSTLPEGYRVSGTWRNEVSSFGSSFTVRKFRTKPYSLTELIHVGTLDYKLASYLWQLMEFKGFIIVAGPSATGKTTMLNSLATLLNPNWKVVSIEDVRELNIPHPGWKALHTRVGGVGGMGKVDLFDLVKLSLRERPDYIILGEARGEEVKVLFQSAATGHGCLTTFHASNEKALQARITQPPISISPSLLNLIDALVILVRDSKDGKRYVYKVLEYDEGWRLVYQREGSSWTGAPGNKLSMLAEAYGLDARSLTYQLSKKESFLQEMVRREVFDYEKLSENLRMFYAS